MAPMLPVLLGTVLAQASSHPNTFSMPTLPEIEKRVCELEDKGADYIVKAICWGEVFWPGDHSCQDFVNPQIDKLLANCPKPILTPAQVKYLADIRTAAERASTSAEQELLKEFNSFSFKLGLMLNGGSRAWKLATTKAEDLLAQFKGALDNVEYVSNFGVDPDYRKSHPGEPEMDFATIDKFGYIPNMWELRAANSPLVKGTSMNQWNVLESAEKGLYQFPLDSKPLPVGPNSKEALERPHYLGGNLRSIDVGLPKYGPFSAVVRNDVVRQRAAILAGDSGGWQNGCNSSITPVRPMPPAMKARFDCNAYMGKGEGHPIPGTADHQLHTILANADFFGKVGGSYERLRKIPRVGKTSYLPRLVYQLLGSKAKATPFETLLYTEAGLLGPLRPQDMKMIVASFAGVYGTAEGKLLQDFCKKHRVPLVWGLNGGETWSAPSKDPARLGPDTESSVDVAPERLLDFGSIQFTNASLDLDYLAPTVWDEVHKDVAAQRAKGSKLQASHFIAWWKQVSSFGIPIQAPRPGDCASVDLCFGTYRPSKGEKDCVCKLNETDTAAFTAAKSVPREGESSKQGDMGVLLV